MQTKNWNISFTLKIVAISYYMTHMFCKQNQTNSFNFICKSISYDLQILALNIDYSFNALLLLNVKFKKCDIKNV